MDHQQRGLVWNWSPEIWNWIPAQGRWHAGHGFPRKTAYLEASTQAAEPNQAYDFWRETVWYGFDGDPRPAAAGFSARGSTMVGGGSAFTHFVSDAVSGGRTAEQIRRDGHDGIDFGLVLAGKRHARMGDDSAEVAGPGGFFVYDAAKASRVEWQEHEGLHLSLRREAVSAALGATLPSANVMVQALATSPLRPVLQAHLMALICCRDMSWPEQGFLLDQAERLALFALERAVSFERKANPEDLRAALFLAARHHIARHSNDARFDVDRLAQILAVSRATLYRAFAEHEVGVNEAIREMRLVRAQRMLTLAPGHVPISEIAARCGFAELRSFHRAFRARFGMSPGTARQDLD